MLAGVVIFVGLWLLMYNTSDIRPPVPNTTTTITTTTTTTTTTTITITTITETRKTGETTT